MKARSSRRTVDAPHVERAYRDLKAGIVKGRYRPGASLSEVSLASEHGMSRTPIREGLARLWQEGYLDRVVGHGYFVARVTVQQIHDTFDVRRLLEGAAAARAAELASRTTSIACAAGQVRHRHPGLRQSESATCPSTRLAACGATVCLELIERCHAQVDRSCRSRELRSFTETRRKRTSTSRPRSPRRRAAARAGWKRISIAAALMKDALLRGHSRRRFA